MITALIIIFSLLAAAAFGLFVYQKNLDEKAAASAGTTTQEEEQTTTDPKPVATKIDCAVSNWSDWSACDADCGGGTRIRSRTITQEAQNGGAACGDLSESQACNTDACAVNCELSSWGDWSGCSNPCGGGEQTRSRSVLREAEHGGTACGELSSSRPCNVEPCASDCELSSWSKWSDCSADCGSGEQSRFRFVVSESKNGGAACGELKESRSCDSGPCPIDCVMDTWGGWGKCSADCGSGVQYRDRIVLQPEAYGGVPCGATMDSRPCNTICVTSVGPTNNEPGTTAGDDASGGDAHGGHYGPEDSDTVTAGVDNVQGVIEDAVGGGIHDLAQKTADCMGGCPDGWTYASLGGTSMCTAPATYTGSCSPISQFPVNEYTPSKRREWAANCGATWNACQGI